MSVFRSVFFCGNIEVVPLPIDHVRRRIVQRGLEIPENSLASTIAAINSGKHVVLVAHDASQEVTVAFAELLADSAAAVHLCIGWLNLHETSGALIHLRDIVNTPFLADIWVILTDPSPQAISRMVDEIRGSWQDSNARLVVVSSTDTLARAELSPAARRTVIPVPV
jgi:hypothetical protein